MVSGYTYHVYCLRLCWYKGTWWCGCYHICLGRVSATIKDATTTTVAAVINLQSTMLTGSYLSQSTPASTLVTGSTCVGVLVVLICICVGGVSSEAMAASLCYLCVAYGEWLCHYTKCCWIA